MNIEPQDQIVAKHPDHDPVRRTGAEFMEVHEAMTEAVADLWEEFALEGKPATQSNLEVVRSRCNQAMKASDPEIANVMQTRVAFDQDTRRVDVSAVPRDRTVFRIYREGTMVYGPEDELG